MKKLTMLLTLTVSLMSISNTNAGTAVGNPGKAKVVKHLQKKTGQRITPIEKRFISGFTAGDGSDCDPLVPDCSGCGWFEKYMCEGMIPELADIKR